MIQELQAAWELFFDSFLTGWAIAVLLGVTGVLVVARNQIFLGAAVSQASTLGVALSLALPAWLDPASAEWLEDHEELVAALFAVGLSVTASVIVSRAARAGRHTHEALAGQVFLAAASLAILLVHDSPHSLEEVHRLLVSSVSVATRADTWTFGALAALACTVSLVCRDRLALLALDPGLAEALGVRVRRWDSGLAIWLGLAIGLAIDVAGLLFAFGCLVLPTLIARELVATVRPLLWLAPAVALAAAGLGFAWAHVSAYPQEQLTVAIISALLILARLVGSRRRGRRGRALPTPAPTG